MPDFAVTLVHGPGWDDARGIREHAGGTSTPRSWMGCWTTDSSCSAVRPDDGRQTMHLVQADDADDVRRRFAVDPWAQAGLLEIGSIRTWTLWPDSRSIASGA